MLKGQFGSFSIVLLVHVADNISVVELCSTVVLVEDTGLIGGVGILSLLTVLVSEARIVRVFLLMCYHAFHELFIRL